MPKRTRDDLLAASLMEGRKARKTETFRKEKPARSARAKEAPAAQATNVQRSVPGLDFFRNLRQRDQVPEAKVEEPKPDPTDSVWQEDEDMDWAFVDAAKTVTPESEETDNVAKSAKQATPVPNPDEYHYSNSDSPSDASLSQGNYSGIGQGSPGSSRDESVIALANAVSQELPEETKKKPGLFSFFKGKSEKKESTEYQSGDAELLQNAGAQDNTKPKRKGLFDFFKKQPAAIDAEPQTEPQTVDLRSEMGESARAEAKLLQDKADVHSPYAGAEGEDDLLQSLRSTAHDAIDSMIASKWGNEPPVKSPALATAYERANLEASSSNFGAEFEVASIDDVVEFSEPAQVPSMAGASSSNAASRYLQSSSFAASNDLEIDDEMDNPVLEFDPAPVKPKHATLPGVKKTNWEIDDEEIVSITSADVVMPKQTLPNAPKPKTAWDVNDDELESTPVTKKFDIPEEPRASFTPSSEEHQHAFSNHVVEVTETASSPEAAPFTDNVASAEVASVEVAPAEVTPVVAPALKTTQEQPGYETKFLEALPTSQRVTFGLRNKVLLALLGLITLLTALSAIATSILLRTSLTNEFRTKGEAISQALATAIPDFMLNRDSSQVQTLVEQYARIQGVNYILAQDEDLNVFAHTFAPIIPESLLSHEEEQHEEEGATAALEEANISYINPETGETKNILEIEVPVLNGQLGEVRVGMDLDSINAQVNRQVLLITGLLGLAGLLTLGLGVWAAQRTISPIRKLAQLAEQVGRGDLSGTAQVRSNDEVGLLANSLNAAITRLRGMVQTEEERDAERREREVMQQNIGQFLDVAQDIAQGDLTKRGQVTNDVLGNVVDAINVMTEEFAILLQDVQKAANSVNQGSDDVLSTTDEISQKAQQQASEAQRARENVVSVVKGIRRMAENASTSAEAAQRTLQASQLGQQAVTSTLRGMQTLRQDVQGVAERVQQLGKRSQEISEIVETISDIASQTNLLALGAALEAAGAGESGRRFSVVADEVGTLAQRSAQAAQRVAGLITSIQREVNEVIGEVERSTQQAEQGYRVAAQAGQRLEEIADISQQSAMLAETISQATSQQVQSVEGVGKVIQGIAGISEESQQTVLQGREAAERLRILAERLNDSLSRFRLSV